MATQEASTKQGMGIRLSLVTLSLIVLFFAILDSGYLSYLKISDTDAVCMANGKFDCGTVLNSAYSEMFDIPIAFLGLGTNLVILAMLLSERFVPFMRENGVFLEFSAVLFAFLFSVYLVYLQAFVIQSYCQYCLTHEALIAVLFVFTSIRVWRTLNADTEEE